MVKPKFAPTSTGKLISKPKPVKETYGVKIHYHPTDPTAKKATRLMAAEKASTLRHPPLKKSSTFNKIILPNSQVTEE